MDSYLDQTASDTIELLEARLQRIEYVVSGRRDECAFNADGRSANQRLRDLEHALDQLVTNSRFMQDLLKLHKHHLDFFHPTQLWDIPSSLDTASKLSVVLAAASSFYQTASRLTSIHDTPLPTAESSAHLVDTRGRATAVEVLQESQLREIAALKERSAAVLQRWYSVDILQTGECWADLEGRVEFIEKAVRRAKSAKQNKEDTF